MLCPVVVGRDAELAALRTALGEAEYGRGSVVVLAGPPGMGKSRLLGEVLDDARGHADLVGAGRSLRSASATAFRPLAEALLQAVRSRDSAPGEGQARSQSVWRAVLPFGEEGGSIVGFSAGGLELARGETVLRLLRTVAVEAPLVVGLDDLQWVDPDTLGVLEYLADNLRGERVLCIATVRSEPRSAAYERLRALGSRRSAAVFRLAPLKPSEVTEMVRACWPAIGAAELDRVLAAADGVPFLVEELLAAPDIPETFATSVAVRLAGLEGMERRVVEAAAVLGRHFAWELLSDVTGAGPEVIASALEHAVDELLLTHKGGVYLFRHALTREAVLDQVLPHTRASLARRALAAVEAAHPGLPGVWRGVAADLAQQAGQLDVAAQLLIDAGRESLRAGALATAVISLMRASTFAVDPLVRCAAQELLVQTLALSGRADECLALGAQLLASPSLSPSAGSAVHLWLAQAAVEATWWAEAGHHLTAAEHLLAFDPDPTLTTRRGVLAAETALAVGELDEARRLADGVIGSADTIPEVRCHAFVVLGRAERVSSLDRAKMAFERSRVCADAHGLPLWRLRALHELGTIDLLIMPGPAGWKRPARRRRTWGFSAWSLSWTFNCRRPACSGSSRTPGSAARPPRWPPPIGYASPS